MDDNEKDFSGFKVMVHEMVTAWNCYTVDWVCETATIRNYEGEVMGTFQYISGGYRA